MNYATILSQSLTGVGEITYSRVSVIRISLLRNILLSECLKKFPNPLFICNLYSVIRKPHSYEFIGNFPWHSDKRGSTVLVQMGVSHGS